MDFFEHQHVARKRTGRLVILFILAVAGIIALVYPVLMVIVYAATQAQSTQTQSLHTPALADMLWNPRALAGVTAAVVAVVGLSSLYKLAELRGGGRVIAESLGGRLLDPGSATPDERKVLNVVEEMAIASGVPVPPVYLMDNEQAINAFAAGYSPRDAVIGVTRGCVELLDRDELQGVMAHEFSHILNGDMRLNIRLISVVFGILAIGTIGSVILRSLFYAPRRTSSNSKEGGGAILFFIAVAVALLVIGSLGVFFGNLIKAAVSRQREFLADAAAVQFTRNPDGIAGALRKIGGLASGARLAHPKAEEASHMYFGEGVPHWLGGLMATHPPLPQRIKRIDPSWNGEFPHVTPTRTTQVRHEKLMRMQEDRGALAQRMAAARADLAGVAAAVPLVAQVGQPTPQHVEHARAMVQSLDPRITAAAHEAYGARALVYALLLDAKDDAVRQAQADVLRGKADPRVAELTWRLADAAARLDPGARLAVIDMAMPALREMSAGQFDTFRACLDALIGADRRVDVFEWALRRIVLRHLATQHGHVKPPVVQYYNLRGVREPCAVLLSALAYVGHREKEPALRAFAMGASAMGLPDLQPKPPEACALPALGEALDVLCQVAPRVKRQVVTGAATCVAADREATVEEVELLRAVCDTLDAPMPLMLPGQRLV